MRGKAHAFPLRIEMASGDPITLIRQQARYAIADIQDTLRLAGKQVPDVKLPTPRPLEAHYPPRGLKWTDTTFRDLPPTAEQPPRSLPALPGFLDGQPVPRHFRDRTH